MSKADFKALIDFRIDEAAEALRDAEFLLNDGRYRAAANRLYYASFYAVSAVLLTKQLQYSKHSAVITFFDKEFIKTGVFPPKHSRTLHRAFNERQQDDYMPFGEMDADEIKDLFADVQTLVNGISEYVTKNS